MSPELISVIVLAVLFAAATWLRINMGVLAIIAAGIVGVALGGFAIRDVAGMFPGTLFVTVVGTTLLMGIAQFNGTVDWIVRVFISAVRGRVVLLPWVLFVISTLMAAVGPGAVPLLAGVGARFIKRYNLNPLLVGLMIVHGAQAGALAPVTVYGVIINEILVDWGLTPDPVTLYLSVLIFNTIITIAGFFLFGGIPLLRRRDHLSGHEERALDGVVPVGGSHGMVTDTRAVPVGGGAGVHLGAGGEAASARSSVENPVHPPSSRDDATDSGPGAASGAGTAAEPETAVAATAVAVAEAATDTEHDGDLRVTKPSLFQVLTLGGILLFLVLAMFFAFDLGFTSLAIAGVLLLFMKPADRSESVMFIGWRTLLVICGVLTYVNVMEELGTVTWVTELVASVGSPLVAMLLACYIAAAVSAVASSTALIGILIPLALPIAQAGDLSMTGTIAAIFICATIVDVSPFSTYGALVLANSYGVDQNAYQKKLTWYTGLLILVAPPLAWGALVLSGILP